MSGTSWHIKTLKSNNKRHNSRCKYYDTDLRICDKTFLKYCGSAYYSYYKEVER